MSFDVTCEGCRAVLDASEEDRGRIMVCPSCRADVYVPGEKIHREKEPEKRNAPAVKTKELRPGEVVIVGVKIGLGDMVSLLLTIFIAAIPALILFGLFIVFLGVLFSSCAATWF